MGLKNLSEHEPEAPQFEDPNPLEPREVAGVDAVGTQILQVLDSPEQVSEVIPEQPEFPPDALPKQFEAPLRGYSTRDLGQSRNNPTTSSEYQFSRLYPMAECPHIRD